MKGLASHPQAAKPDPCGGVLPHAFGAMLHAAIQHCTTEYATDPTRMPCTLMHGMNSSASGNGTNTEVLRSELA
jgi:hypothetical protein